MKSPQALNFSEFQKAITPLFLYVYRSILVTFFLGVSYFAGDLIYTYTHHVRINNKIETSVSGFSILSLMHILLAILCYIASSYICRQYMNPKNLHKITTSPYGLSLSSRNDTNEQKYLMAIIDAAVGRAALFGCPAIIGIIICTIGYDGSQNRSHPIFFGNLFSYLFFVFMIVYTFPSKRKLENIFKQHHNQVNTKQLVFDNDIETAKYQ
jgi:hypothetical protein